MSFWDERYATDEYVFGEAPNAFLASQRERLAGYSNALAVADGEGRNGVWLAEQGLAVTSVDASLVRNYILPIAGPNHSITRDTETLEIARLEAEQTLAILDTQLGEQFFFCTEHWSIADALLTPMLDYLMLITEPAGLLSQWPRLRDYLERMRTRPSGCAVLQSTPAR